MNRRRVAALVVLVAVSCGAIAIGVGVSRRRVADTAEVSAHDRANAPRSHSKPGAVYSASGASSGQEDAKPEGNTKLEGERFAVPAAGTTELPVSEIPDADAEKRRQWFWLQLRSFAVEADLTEAQWQTLLGDLSDLALSGIAAHSTAAEENSSMEDANRLTDELALEFEERCASWMTAKQRRVFWFRFHPSAMLTVARQLRTFDPLVRVSAARP